MDNGTRDELLRHLAVGSLTIAHPTRVAVDGPAAAGKTTLADEVAVVPRAQLGCGGAPRRDLRPDVADPIRW